MSKREPFTPDEIRAAETEAAREEGRREGLREASQSLSKTSATWARLVGSGFDPAALRISQEIAACASAIEAKANEAGR
jgi:uncharacterized protein YukE